MSQRDTTLRDSASREELGDAQAVRDVLARYWRGIDRRDRALVASAYHPGAYDDHGYYKGPVDGFIASLEPGVYAYFENTQHFAGQIDVEITGDGRARAESYAEAHHIRREPDGTRRDLVYGLRYVDRFERRDGIWRIAHRVCTWDWHRVDEGVGLPLPPSYFRGCHSHDDPVFAHPVGSGARIAPAALAAKRACADTLMRYARGVDRCAPELVRSTYHADAYDDHGGYQGDADGFVAWVKPTVMDAFSVTMHELGNMLIEVDGDRAFAETYAIAHHVSEADGVATDLTMGVRYVDRLERRGGASDWRIAHRAMSFEWERSAAIGSQAAPEAAIRGRRDGGDPVLEVAASARSDAAARSAIYDALVRGCRGLDRRDDALLRAAFHPDAQVAHGEYRGGLAGYLDFASRTLRAPTRTTMHKLGQVLVEIDGDVARSEAYVNAHYVQRKASGDELDRVVGLRFLDQFERRTGAWRIARREVRFEWQRSDALSPLDESWTLGRPDTGDAVYA